MADRAAPSPRRTRARRAHPQAARGLEGPCIEAVLQRSRIGRRSRLGLRQRGGDLLHDLTSDGFRFGAEAVQLQSSLETLDRIAAGERLAQLARHVRGIVVYGMSVPAERQALDRLRSFPGPRSAAR